MQKIARILRLRDILTQLANTLCEEGVIDERERFIDATFVLAKGGGGIGPTRRGKGVKILAIVDRQGLPLSVSTHAANHHEVTLVQLSFNFYMLEAKPEHPIGDHAYDSDGLDDNRKEDGVDTIAPHRSTRKLKTPDGRDRPARSTPLARRTVLGLNPVEAKLPGPLGVPCNQFARVGAACIHHHATQAVLR